jgi:hypothetical protein
MDDQEHNVEPPPYEEPKPRYALWWIVALSPTAFGLLCIGLRDNGRFLLMICPVLDVICSVVGGIGLACQAKTAASRFFAGLFMVPFFILLNAAIVLFIGCSGVGRIAP